jgi:hypothetical protein
MKNSVKKLQTEYLYDIIYNEEGYTVIQIENLDEGYLQWDVFDDLGFDIEQSKPKLREELIAFVLENT